MTSHVDRTVGRLLGAVVGTAACFATFFVLLLSAVALTRPDVTGSRAPGIVLNVLFGVFAIAVGVLVGRALFRRLAA